jgi:hypothetical protein
MERAMDRQSKIEILIVVIGTSLAPIAGAALVVLAR